MTTISDIVSSNVEITLGDTAYTLVPTLNAGMLICQFFGGFLDADQRLKKFDLIALQQVIAFGLGKAAPKNVNELVFSTGVAKLITPAIEFVGILANGGKRFVPEPEVEETKPGNEESAALAA